jgi:hypothetical protein
MVLDSSFQRTFFCAPSLLYPVIDRQNVGSKTHAPQQQQQQQINSELGNSTLPPTLRTLGSSSSLIAHICLSSPRCNVRAGEETAHCSSSVLLWCYVYLGPPCRQGGGRSASTTKRGEYTVRLDSLNQCVPTTTTTNQC